MKDFPVRLINGLIHWGAYTWGGLYMEIISNEKIDGLILGGLILGGGGLIFGGLRYVFLNAPKSINEKIISGVV